MLSQVFLSYLPEMDWVGLEIENREFMIPSGAEERSEKTWSCDPVILRDLAFAAKRVLSPSASKIKQAAGCWSFGRGAKTVSGLLLLVLRKPHSSGRVPTDWIKCMLKHFIINSLPLMSINLFSQLKPQWFWWLRMLGGSATSWSPSPYCFPFLLLPIWVAVTFCRSSPTSTVLPGESHKAESPLKGTRSSVGWCWGSSLTVLGRSRMDASQTSQLEPSLAVSSSVGRFIVGHCTQAAVTRASDRETAMGSPKCCWSLHGLPQAAAPACCSFPRGVPKAGAPLLPGVSLEMLKAIGTWLKHTSHAYSGLF